MLRIIRIVDIFYVYSSTIIIVAWEIPAEIKTLTADAEINFYQELTTQPRVCSKLKGKPIIIILLLLLVQKRSRYRSDR